MMNAMASSASSRPQAPLVPRCSICDGTGITLKGAGNFKKRCANEIECTRRAAEKNAPPKKQALYRAARLTAAPPGPTPTSPAQALLEILQAEMGSLEGPVRYGERVSFPLAAVQARFVQFGKPGCGKSNATTVMIEECLANGVPVLAIDLLGNLWGVRAAGSRPGMSIPILGGSHGDVAITTEDAGTVADIFATGASALIDLSAMSLAMQQRFIANLFRRLSQVLRRPSHIVIEEAESAAPAFSRTASAFDAQGAVTLFARQIRNHGVGWTMSTQRLKHLHPDVIDASSVFMAMQSTGDAAQRALGKEAQSRVGKVVASAILSELGQLARGEAWVIPDPDWTGAGTSAPLRMKIRARHTYDSTAVPKIGEPARKAPDLVAVHIGSYRELREPTTASAPKNRRQRRAQ